MVISRMKTEDVTDAARIEEKIFSTPWSEQSFLEALEQEYTVFFAAKKKEHCVGYIGAYFAADEAEITNVAVEMEYRRRTGGRNAKRSRRAWNPQYLFRSALQ